MDNNNLKSLLENITKKSSLKYNCYRKKTTSQHWTQRIAADMRTRLPDDQYLIWLEKFNNELAKK